MKFNKKGNTIVAVILFILGGAVLALSIMGFIGVGLLQGDIEQEKQNAIAVEGTVYELRYDDSIRHYVADVVYEVDGESYIVTLDTATSNDVAGTPMTVYCNPENPIEVVDEWNSRESYNTYKAGFFTVAIGIALIIGGLKAAGVLNRAKKQYDIDYSKHHSAVSPVDTYKGYDGYNSGQTYNSYDPNVPYNSSSDSQFNSNVPYGSSSNPYDPNVPYSSSSNPYDPNVPYGSDTQYNQYNNNDQNF